MNRRNLLKKMGITALAAPYILLTSPRKQAGAQTVTASPLGMLLVKFVGPFAFCLESTGIVAAAPPVGPTYAPARHEPWMGTTANEIRVLPLPTLPAPCTLSTSTPADSVSVAGPSLNLSMTYTPMAPPPLFLPAPTEILGSPSGIGALTLWSGSEIQSSPPGGSVLPLTPLFSLSVPTPDYIVGTDPASVTVENGSNSVPYTCASGAIFVYSRTAIQSVNVLAADNSVFFQPDFSNDAYLPCATLEVHLTPLCNLDPDHIHAQHVADQMLGMFPAITSRITFDDMTDAGVGDDCAAPIILLG